MSCMLQPTIHCIVNNFVIVDELKYRCNTSVYCVTISIVRAAVNIYMLKYFGCC